MPSHGLPIRLALGLALAPFLVRVQDGPGDLPAGANTPIVTSGADHWALTLAGLVQWTGERLDRAGAVR